MSEEVRVTTWLFRLKENEGEKHFSGVSSKRSAEPNKEIQIPPQIKWKAESSEAGSE